MNNCNKISCQNKICIIGQASECTKGEFKETSGFMHMQVPTSPQKVYNENERRNNASLSQMQPATLYSNILSAFLL